MLRIFQSLPQFPTNAFSFSTSRKEHVEVNKIAIKQAKRPNALDGTRNNAQTMQYRVFINDRTLENIEDEFEKGLNGVVSLNELNAQHGAKWRSKEDVKPYIKLLKLYKLIKKFKSKPNKTTKDFEQALKNYKKLNTPNKLMRASEGDIAEFFHNNGYGQ